MLQLDDFKAGDKAYILYKHIGYNRAAEIFETTVKKVGRKYVTVSTSDKQFKRFGNTEGLLEHTDYGEVGYLYNTREAAENEAKKNNLIHNIRALSDYLYYCSYEELRTIVDILKRASNWRD